jgi:hypothetical protein
VVGRASSVAAESPRAINFFIEILLDQNGSAARKRRGRLTKTDALSLLSRGLTPFQLLNDSTE